MATKKVDFRRLKEERESQKKKRKIESPLAKYNSAGQLFCVLCNAPIKSDLVWPAHVQSKKHRENIAALKNKNTKPSPDNDKVAKPKTVESKNQFVKPSIPDKIEKRKINEANEDDIIPPKRSKVPEKTESSTSLPADFFDNQSDVGPAQIRTETDHKTTTASGLPSDFFENQPETTQESDRKQSSNSKPSEDLPEGFFDDPKLDAKARKVEYKDPQDEEWEKFQKAIQMENQVSEALVEEDDEVARIDRQLTELNEQRQYFLRAHTLRDKQDVIRTAVSEEAKQRREQKDEEDSTSTDSEDFEEFFDWRAKRVI
ncbi:zinc finger protein 830 isoform X2 [Nematostella vectensis]|uniref:zinc finger protein 830 isoform X2 n=1 Tax=Nematostella vectensis TaxID=45351 RepID=UPI00139044D3|nr:zinc finger protein 830 isoform X2 [Nematostella vectensis]